MKLSTNCSAGVLPRRINRHDAREAMILSHLPLVRLVAQSVRRRLPPGTDMEALVHSGVVGLLEAFNRYDPERGVSFRAYARHRIHGEIIQCLRSLDWVSRFARFWGRKISTARKELTATLGREATSEEIAAEIGVSLATYHRIQWKVNQTRQTNIEDPDAILSDDGPLCAEENRSSHEDPFRFVEHNDLMHKLREAIRVLPERERQVIELHHRDELTLREIGRRMGVTEGRICQIYNRARTRLRSTLGGN